MIDGPVPGRTLLGNAAGAVVESARVARVEQLVVAAGGAVVVGLPAAVELRVSNPSDAIWPVLTGVDDHPVEVVCEWTGTSAPPQRLRLPWDLGPGESVTVFGAVSPPPETGRHTLRCGVEQSGRPFKAVPAAREVAVRRL